MLEAFPSFFGKHPVTPTENFSSEMSMELRVQNFCTVVLVKAAKVNPLAGSTDGVVAFSHDNGDVTVDAVEIKSIASITTSENAKRICSQYRTI